MKIELTIPLANAIIDMDDISYGEGLGPRTVASNNDWKHLVRAAEDVAERKSDEHRGN